MSQSKTKNLSQSEELDEEATHFLTRNGWIDQMVPESQRGEDSSPVRTSADWLAGSIEDFLDLNLTKTGFTIQGEERTTEVIHYCQWRDEAGACMEELYGSTERRGRGRPRKWCPKHQKDAKARTERLRKAGISIDTHRNLSYRPKSEPKPEPVWTGNPANGLGGKCVDQYEQNRQVWRKANLPRSRY